MKKIAIRISLLVILVAVLLLGSVSPVSAAPDKVYVTINTLQPGQIDFSYGWNKIWAYSYTVQVDNKSHPKVIFYQPNDFAGGRVKEFDDQISFSSVDITSGDTIVVYLSLYDKFGGPMHNGSFSIEVTCP